MLPSPGPKHGLVAFPPLPREGVIPEAGAPDERGHSPCPHVGVVLPSVTIEMVEAQKPGGVLDIGKGRELVVQLRKQSDGGLSQRVPPVEPLVHRGVEELHLGVEGREESIVGLLDLAHCLKRDRLCCLVVPGKGTHHAFVREEVLHQDGWHLGKVRRTPRPGHILVPGSAHHGVEGVSHLVEQILNGLRGEEARLASTTGGPKAATEGDDRDLVRTV